MVRRSHWTDARKDGEGEEVYECGIPALGSFYAVFPGFYESLYGLLNLSDLSSKIEVFTA